VASKSVLGKGLASLLPAGVQKEAITAGPPPGPPVQKEKKSKPEIIPATSQASSTSERIPGITMAKLENISVNPHQPRRQFSEDGIKELSESIKVSGIIQPLLVRKHDKGFQLIAGERRFRAAKKAGLQLVPVVVRQSTDKEALELALVENIQRKDLNCIEEANGYFQLANDFKLTQEEIAKQVGKDRATVANMLRLLKLPSQVIEDLKTGVLSFGHGKVLLSLEDRTVRLKVRNDIIENKLSVRQTEERVREIKRLLLSGSEILNDPKEKVETLNTSTQIRLNTISRDLTRIWGSRVKVTGTERSGKIVIRYGSRQDLDRILGAMQNESIWPKT